MNTFATPTKNFVDFKEVKSKVSIVQVLERYDLIKSLKPSGDRLSGPCPIHKGSNPTHFRVSVGKNCFNCFGECSRGGNVIDFVSMMEGVEFRDAALLLQEWFMTEQPAVEVTAPNQTQSARVAEAPATIVEVAQVERQPTREESAPEEETEPNTPLDFELQSLENEHPYFDERGIKPDTIAEFGLGYCKKGVMKGRIVFPIHNAEGNLVAYIGRWPGDPGDRPKYKQPKDFRRSVEVFNLHRAETEPSDRPLVVVQGFFGCLALWQAGITRCVALMSDHLSQTQENLIRDTLEPGEPVVLLFDENESGRRGRADAAARLAHHTFVRVTPLPVGGQQPDHLSSDELVTL